MIAKVEFEEVFYTQSLFRQLLDAMARPGKLVVVEPAPKALCNSECRYLFGIGLTLLDRETVFHFAAGEPETAAMLQLYTMSRSGPPEACDFLFVRGDEHFEVERLRRGTFEFPDRSATVVCQVRCLSETPFPATDMLLRFTLRGPGIRGERVFYVDSLHVDMVESWRKVNSEFPLGIDWIIVDGTGRACAIPRSTQFKWEVF